MKYREIGVILGSILYKKKSLSDRKFSPTNITQLQLIYPIKVQ
jgi:hypothetical protein